MKTFFFGLLLISLREKNRARASFPPMMKIGQNWGEIANYPPYAQQRSAPLLLEQLGSLTNEASILKKFLLKKKN